MLFTSDEVLAVSKVYKIISLGKVNMIFLTNDVSTYQYIENCDIR